MDNEKEKPHEETPEQPQRGADIHIDLGLGGVFKGIGNLLDLISQLADESQDVSRGGEIKFGEGEKLRGVYGFSIRTGIGGVPRVESFGNIRETDEGPVVEETREPLIDIFDEGDTLLVVAELPGVALGEISITVHGDIIELATTGKYRFAKEVLLPAPARSEDMTIAYNNGVLEARFRKA